MGVPPERPGLWTAAATMASAPLLLTLCAVLWRTPYPISEAVAVITDGSDAFHLSTLFDPSVRSWYRPMYGLTWTALIHGTGSLDLSLQLFKGLEVVASGALILLLIGELRPRTPLDAAAATFAIAVLVGTPGFRDNLEIPLLMTLVAMPLVVIVWHLLEGPRRWWNGPLIILLTLVAIGFKEQGLVLVPVVVVAWWMGAPGIGRVTAASIVVVTLAYLAFRFSASGSWPPFVQDVGFGFRTLSPDQAAERFGRFPVAMYGYNVAATILNILFAEPTAGTFTALAQFTRGEITPGEVTRVLSSSALSAVIAWWGIATLRRDVGNPWSRESRLVGILVIAIAASGALGFNYTRDRLAGMAVVFYAAAAFFAVRALAERVMHGPHRRAIAMSAALLLLASAWQVRAIGTIEHARLTAWKNRREWITNLQARRTEFAREPGYLRVLNSMVRQGTDPVSPAPTQYPGWAAAVIGGG